MRRSILIAAPLVAMALVGQSVPALAGSAPGTRAALAAALPAPGSAGDRNLTAWINAVEANPNKFDQNLEEKCIQDGGPACDMTGPEVRAIPNDTKRLTDSLVSTIEGDPQLKSEVTADFAGASEQTRFIGNFTKGVRAIIRAVPNNKAIQALAGRAEKIGDITDNVSRAAYASMGATDVATGAQHYMVAASKVVIYSMPIFGDVFSLGEAIFDPNLTTGQRVETGVVASLSLIGTAAAFAGGPVGLAVGAAIGIGIAAYYAGKAIWGWLSSGLLNWSSQPPPTPEDLYRDGAYIEWEARTVGGHSAALTIPVTGSGRESTVSQTLLVDSRWTDYNRNGTPVTYMIEPYSHARNVPQGLYLRSYWGATKATLTVWQNRASSTQECHATGVTSHFSPTYHFFMCGPRSTVKIALNQPAVLKVTYTYSLADNPCGTTPCFPGDEGEDTSLSVYTTRSQKVTFALPFIYAVV